MKKLLTINQGYNEVIYAIPFPVDEKSDIAIRGLAAGGSGDISAGFDLWYEANGT